MNEPTEKQEKAVGYICKKLNICPPKEYSKQSYWKFINKYLIKARYSVNEDEESEYENYNDEAEHLFMDGGGYY